eukprot:302901-Chlamydomonas_euryale.AAC.1
MIACSVCMCGTVPAVLRSQSLLLFGESVSDSCTLAILQLCSPWWGEFVRFCYAVYYPNYAAWCRRLPTPLACRFSGLNVAGQLKTGPERPADA